MHIRMSTQKQNKAGFHGQLPMRACFILYIEILLFERSSSQLLTFGQSVFLASDPVNSPTCPASRTKNSLSSLEIRFMVASACGRVQIWSFFPAIFRTEQLILERSTRCPRSLISPLTSLFCW